MQTVAASGRSVYRGGDSMAQEFKLPSGGLKCQSCGGELPRVYRTIRSSGFVIRERICPECGKINTTAERVVNVRTKERFSDEAYES